MENITNLRDYTVTGAFDIDASIKPDKDSGMTPKHITLRFRMVNVPLADVITYACCDRRIAWANGGSGRKRYETIKDRSVIEVDFQSPGKQVKSRDELVAEAKATLLRSGVKDVIPGITEEQILAMAEKAVDNPK